MINPEILERRGRYLSHEGCLSLPGQKKSTMHRSGYMKLRYTGLDNRERILVARNRDAAMLEHEIDHLNGVLCIDVGAERKLQPL